MVSQKEYGKIGRKWCATRSMGRQQKVVCHNKYGEKDRMRGPPLVCHREYGETSRMCVSQGVWGDRQKVVCHK